MKLVAWLPLLALMACKEPAPPPPPAAAAQVVDAEPDWKTAFKHQARFDAAASALIVDVVVAPGFHAYTVGETVGKPMAVELSDDSAYGLDGEVVYPAGTVKELPIGRSVIVEGAASIQAKVKAKADPKGAIKGTFRYQVCNDASCDRPRSEAFSLTPT